MSGVLRATSIARSCIAVGGFLKTFSRTKAVSGFTLCGDRSDVISPFSSISRPSWGLAARPWSIARRALLRRLIWALSPASDMTKVPAEGRFSILSVTIFVSRS